MSQKTSAAPIRPEAKKHKLESRFRNIQILFFLLVTAIMGLAASRIIGNISDEASREYARLYSVEAVAKFTAYLDRELALVAQVSRSGALYNWFADETNQEKADVAYAEMTSYASMLYNPELYVGIHSSLNEYAIQEDTTRASFKPFDVLSEEKVNHHWYFECIDSPRAYTLNIDIATLSTEKRLWINYKVMRNAEILGIFCSGLHFEHVFATLFGGYDHNSVRGFVVDAKGVIQMDSAQLGQTLPANAKPRRIHDFFTSPDNIAELEEYFSKINQYFKSNDPTQLVQLGSGQYRFVSLAPIVGTTWSIVSFFNSESLFSPTKLLPLLYTVFLILTAYIIGVRVLNKRLIFTPFNKLIRSLHRASTNEDEQIYGYDLPNELGEISQTIQHMRESLAANNRQLLGAMQAAEIANQAKDNFLANMSHEMRTPLNAIVGMSAIGKTSSELERKNYTFTRIEEASAHLLALVNDLLDMSKLEVNTLELAVHDFNAAQMTEKLVNHIKYRIDEKQQRLSVTVDEQITAWLVGDEQRLLQVLVNLFSNAIKFTPEKGSVALQMQLVEKRASDCTVRFKVIDSGVGISQEQQEGIFQIFKQVDESSSRTFGGAGLGLAISKRIVELMAGQVWIESATGKGATFIFTAVFGYGSLPENSAAPASVLSAAPEGEAGDEGKAQVSSQEDSPIKSYAGKRVLLVEDVELNREICMALLEPAELEISCAVNGEEALAMFTAKPDYYDLIFMDIQMPKMDGLEATRRIRALDTPRAGTIPIVAMTANVFQDDIDRSKSAGMNAHIGKPLDIKLVFTKLSEFL